MMPALELWPPFLAPIAVCSLRKEVETLNNADIVPGESMFQIMK
jgi:hypothetical protein